MWTRRLLRAAPAAVLVVLMLASGMAAANRLRLTTTNFSIRWREFNVPTGQTPELSEPRLRHCPLTLSGSFHSATIAKVRGALIGYVGTPQMGTCTGEGGTVTLLLRTGLPWHLTYRDFLGTLPSITGFHLALLGFRMSIEVPPLFGEVCLITTTAREPLDINFTREAGGAVTSAGGTESRIVARNTTGFLCEGLTWAMGGNGTLDNGSGARVTVTLI